MSDDRSWVESIPSVSENRVRYIVFLLFLTLAIIFYLAKIPVPKSGPPDNLFVNSPQGDNNMASGRSRLADILGGQNNGNSSTGNSGSGSNSNISNASGNNGTGQYSTGYNATANNANPNNYTNQFGNATNEGVSLPPRHTGNTLPLPTLLANNGGSFGNNLASGSRTNTQGGNSGGISNLTFENLMAKTGFNSNQNMSQSMSQSIVLPSDLPGLLRVIGGYQRKKDLSALGLIAGKQRYSNKARALALGALRHFTNAREASDILQRIIESPDEPFFVREAALSSLLHIDGEAFEEFYSRLTLTQLKSAVKDMRICELLVLAAYGDAVIYRGRSLKKLLPKLEALGNQSELAQALASFKLRLPGAKAHPTDIARYRTSTNVTVLSNFIAYLRQRSLFDEEARKTLHEFSSRHSLPLVRQMAMAALGMHQGG